MTAGLLDRTTRFIGALREAGVPVSLAESIDAARALTVVPLIDRDAFRSALAATTCKRAAHRHTFDALFELWFPPAIGDAESATSYGDVPIDGEPAGPMSEADPEIVRDLLRRALERLLLEGDDEGLRRLAREAVNRLGRAESRPGRQNWFGYRVLRSLDPETLIASLLASMLQPDQRGTFAERVARRTISERIRAFESYVEAEIRRRLAEEKGPERVAQTAVQPLIEQVDFLRASRKDLVELRRTVYPLARRLATRLTARRRTGRSGRLDFRRTIRASLATGGVPVDVKYRAHKPRRPELVVLCDVSGSVSSFAHFTLMLTYALREQFTRVRAFAFIDTCDEVTEFFGPGGDIVDAFGRMLRESRLVWYDGHSDYGHALETFTERWPDAVSPRTSLLILGDARTNYRPPGLATLRHLVAETRHAYWLNPEPRAYWGSGDSAAFQYADLVEMVECRNAAQLAEFVTTLLPT